MTAKKKKYTYRLTLQADNWISNESKKQGISKNNIVQILINNAMKREEKSEAKANG